MTDPTTSPTTPAAQATPSAAAAAAAPPAPTVPVHPPGSTNPPGSTHLVSPRRGIVLTVLALAWLAIALWRSSYGPAGGYMSLIAVLACGAALLGLWLLAALWALATRGKMGRLGWIGVPLALLVWGVLPWGSWLFPLRVRAAEPELRAFAEQNGHATETAPRDVDQTIGGIRFRQVGRGQGATLLRFRAAAASDAGLAFAPGMQTLEPPSWSVRDRTTAVMPGWFWYEWRRE